MIVGNIKDAKRYFCINKNFEKAFEFLASLDENSEKGPFEFEGFRGNVLVTETSDVSADGGKKPLEAHREYLDIHYVLDGCEAVGYADIDTLDALTDYNEKDDYLLLQGDSYKVILGKGDFCIVFPEDAHTPCMCAGEGKNLKKAVVKILV